MRTLIITVWRRAKAISNIPIFLEKSEELLATFAALKFPTAMKSENHFLTEEISTEKLTQNLWKYLTWARSNNI